MKTVQNIIDYPTRFQYANVLGT